MSETKSLLAHVKNVGDESGPGSWTAVVSSDSVDRDGEVVDAHAFDPLPPKLPVADKHFGSIVGSGTPYYVGSELHFNGVFASAPLAQTVRSLVQEGHLSSMSVAFLVSKGGDRYIDGVRHVVKAELVAVDWAAIPSNREARLLAVRSVKDDDDIEVELREKATYLRLRGQLAALDLQVMELEKKELAHEKERSRRAWKMARRLLAEERAEEAAAKALAESRELHKRNPSRWAGPGFSRAADGTRIDSVQTYVPDRSPTSSSTDDGPALDEWGTRNVWPKDPEPRFETIEDRRRRLLAPKTPDE